MLIETREASRVYQMGTNQVTALDRVSMGVGRRRVRRDSGNLRFGKINAAEFAGRSGSADQWRSTFRCATARSIHQEADGALSSVLGGDDLSKLQLDSDDDGG